MKYQKGTRRRAAEYEKDLVQYWKANKTFEKSVRQRPASEQYVFYDGPPFITGVPHHGNLLSSIAKDVVPRYWTMRGKRVERVWGWDCHGLPAEVFTEKKLGIQDRRDIGTKVSLEDYINTCRENMVATGSLWEDTIDRIGRWVDFKGAYRTMDKDYMESVWWAFKQLYEKGKIYEGERVLMYCTRDATPLSKAEVTMDAGAYKDVSDPSVYVKFRLQKAKDSNSHKDITIELIDLNGADNLEFAAATRLWPAYAEKIKKKQSDNKAVLFAAKIGDKYVGRVTLWLDEWKDNDEMSGESKTVTDYYPNLPAINALEVREEFRRRGVATALMQAAEAEARKRGFSGVGLGVELDNQPALALYEKCGYVKRPIDGDDTYHIWWQEKDTGGETHKYEMDCYLMTKDIKSGKADTYLLAWTTTPWTLPANTAVAVHKDIEYAEVEVGGERLIMAKARLDTVLTDEKHKVLEYTVLRTFKGSELVGKSYEPLFEDRNTSDNQNAHKVWDADYVSVEDGTDIVHLAPAYGEEDYALSKQHNFPFVINIDENGFFKDGEWAGQNVWEANKPIAKALKEQGVVWKIEYITHSYPHCYRCGTKLMYRAHPSWFMDIAGEKSKMLEENQNIHWFPEHLKHGRFQKTVESAPDWNLSRDRFWATAMPVWKGVDANGGTRDAEGREYIKVVGSYAELKELSGEELADYHRPWVDDITFDIDGVHYSRIDKVMDCWFESGSMPFAQFHYPFENKEKFEATFPGDYIVEYVSQVRAWFYYVHAVNTALFGHNAYKNVIVTGTLMGTDGRKLSKSLNNFTDPNELMDQYSADSLRFFLMSSPIMSGEDATLKDKDVGDIARKLSMVWNMYDFFTLYASVDGWDSPQDPYSDPLAELNNPLDRWIVSRAHQLTAEVAHNLDAYDIPNASKPILPFLDDASNWYVRRSRRRFWRASNTASGSAGEVASDADKQDAYRTLHYVLVRLSHVLAPFTPFLAEELYRKLTGGESVHLRDWPSAAAVDTQALASMSLVRDAITMGLSKRAEAGIKVRQPLAGVAVSYPLPADGQESGAALGENREFYEDIIREELNVKAVQLLAVNGADETMQVQLDTTITPDLKREGQVREVIRQVQNSRKAAGLDVDDRIMLRLVTHDSNLQQAIDEHADTIRAETLTSQLMTDGAAPAEGYTAEVTIDGAELAIAVLKQT